MQLTKSLFQNISKILARRKIYLTRSLSFRQRPDKLPISFDFVRYTTLELCYEEIILKNIKGNVAELGVYKGEFSKKLNQLFSDRKIYLFDTFEGFDDKDIHIEKEQKFSDGKQDFSDTSIDLVMQKMTYPENCIIKKGFFPETAEGINDRFCFVSLDTDLYEPIYQGLLFFYPKLEKGGYIFVHDFNNDGYKGTRHAVTKFCTENNISYVPIPDNSGTVIITK